MSKSPKYVGPGYWTAWHLKSLHCKTFKEKSELSRQIMLDIKFFPCEKCRTDATRYVKENKINPAIRSNDEMSMFKWLHKFHNYVNKKIGKKVLSYEDALKEWIVNGVCMDEDCVESIKNGGEENKISEEKEIENPNSIYLNILAIE